MNDDDDTPTCFGLRTSVIDNGSYRNRFLLHFIKVLVLRSRYMSNYTKRRDEGGHCTTIVFVLVDIRFSDRA